MSQIVALFDSLFMRLIGISIASFSSGTFLLKKLWVSLMQIIGLGELTFLQLSTTYSPASVAGRSIRYEERRIYNYRRMLRLE